MACNSITKRATAAILSGAICLTALAQVPPTPVLSELKRTEPPHVDMTFSIPGDATNVIAFKIVRKVLAEGTSNGRHVEDRTIYVARERLRGAIYKDGQIIFPYVDKKLHPNLTTVYLYYVMSLSEEGESAESNKIELHP